MISAFFSQSWVSESSVVALIGKPMRELAPVIVRERLTTSSNTSVTLVEVALNIQGCLVQKIFFDEEI